MKKILSLIICIFMLFNQTKVNAEPIQIPVTVNVNGEEIDFSSYGAYPYIDNGATMLPFRSIFEKFGGYIDTKNYGMDKTIEFQKIEGAYRYTLSLNQNEQVMRLFVEGVTDDRVFFAKYFNPIDIPIVNIDGRIYVPFRAISECFGYNVSWDQNTKTVDVDTTSINIDYRKCVRIDEVYLGPDTSDYTKQLLDLVNNEREKEGLPPFISNDYLNSLAQATIVNMVNYYPYYPNFTFVLTKGENATEVMDICLDPYDKAILLNADYDDIGIGMFEDSNGVKHWIQIFVDYN